MTKPYLPEILRLFLTDDSTKQYLIEFRGSMDFYIFQLIWKQRLQIVKSRAAWCVTIDE